MYNNETIKLAFVLDDNYVEQISSVIRSIIYSNKNNTFDTYFFFNTLSIENQKKLHDFHSENFKINFESTNLVIEGVGPVNHVSNATFVKFEIINRLINLDKVLYLDGDITVTDDLMPLWKTDINEFFLAAVENPFTYRNKILKMGESSTYFNAGVMLLNLKKMRDFDFAKKAYTSIELLKDNLIFHDQDIFNHLADGCFLPLDKKYNFQTFFIRKIHKYNRYERRQTVLSLNNSVIIHYSSGIKPWYKLDPHPKAELFRKFYHGQVKFNSSEPLLWQFLRYLYVKTYYLIFLRN